MRVDGLTIVICLDHASLAGGQEKVAVDSAIGLKRAGHRPILFTAVGPPASALADAGIEVICLGQSDLLGASSKVHGAIQGVWNMRAAKALGDLLSKLPRENTIIHVHGWSKALSPSIARPIIASKLPTIFTLHDYFMFCPTGGFYNYQTQSVCKLKPLSLSCLAASCDSVSYPRKIWRSGRLAFANDIVGFRGAFSDFICISQLQREIIADHLPSDSRMHFISNPISISDSAPKTNPASGAFTFVGRISPEKGPLLFAEAARLAGVVPTFVGDGPLANTLREKYPEANVLGWQPPTEARKSLRNARALVFPSLWYEGQPLTVLEAKAYGTPVIVSDACAGREAIANGIMGEWFASGDAAALARAITRLKNDEIIASMSSAAYADYWSDPLTLERHVAGLEKAYRSLTQPKASGQSVARIGKGL